MWLISVVAAPSAVIGILYGIGEDLGTRDNTKSSDMRDGGLLILFILCLILHLVTSRGLQMRIFRSRKEPKEPDDDFGILLGLVFGGWALTAAIAFAGCLTVMSLGAYR